jgi:hypothetical protein
VFALLHVLLYPNLLLPIFILHLHIYLPYLEDPTDFSVSLHLRLKFADCEHYNFHTDELTDQQLATTEQQTVESPHTALTNTTLAPSALASQLALGEDSSVSVQHLDQTSLSTFDDLLHYYLDNEQYNVYMFLYTF